MLRWCINIKTHIQSRYSIWTGERACALCTRHQCSHFEIKTVANGLGALFGIAAEKKGLFSHPCPNRNESHLLHCINSKSSSLFDDALLALCVFFSSSAPNQSFLVRISFFPLCSRCTPNYATIFIADH